MDNNSNRLTALDSLRGIAILMVICGHASVLATPQAEWLLQFSRLGARGVQLFYVVSAFSLFLSFRNRSKAGHFSYAGYFIRRFARIAPMFWFSIALYLWVYGMAGNYWAPDGLTPLSVGLTAIFMHGWYPTTINSVVPGGWSIAVETTFYLLLPICFVWVRSLRAAIIATIICLLLRHTLGAWYMSTFGQDWPSSQTYLPYSFAWVFWLPAQLPVFMLGIVLFFMREKMKVHPDIGVAWLSGAIALIGISQYSTVEALIPDQVVAAMGFMLLCMAALDGKLKILDNTILQTVGKVSFSIYLLHGMMINLGKDAFIHALSISHLNQVPDIAYVIAVLVVSCLGTAVASVTYRWIEQPGISLGGKIARAVDMRNYSPPLGTL